MALVGPSVNNIDGANDYAGRGEEAADTGLCCGVCHAAVLIWGKRLGPIRSVGSASLRPSDEVTEIVFADTFTRANVAAVLRIGNRLGMSKRLVIPAWLPHQQRGSRNDPAQAYLSGTLESQCKN